MSIYKGNIEVVTCSKALTTRIISFTFRSELEMTRDFVKLKVFDLLKKDGIIFFGVSSMTYDYMLEGG